MVKIFRVTILCLFMANWLIGQPLTGLSLSDAYGLLEERYPVLRNSGIMNELYINETAQIDKSRLPSINWKTDGRLQSESPHLDVAEGVMLPFEIDLPLYSVKSYVEAQYLLMDGGITDAQKKLKTAQLKAEQQGIEVDRFALRERINQLFLDVIILRDQSKLFDLSLTELAARKNKLAAGIEYGAVLESELSKIEIKELELMAQQDDISFRLSGLIGTLSQLLGVDIANYVKLDLPPLSAPSQVPELRRPEQQYFQFQQESILASADLIEAGNKPKLSAYSQLGAGYPNPLNFLDKDPALFGVLGLQFNWPITDWGKADLDKEILTLQAMKLQNSKETFEFNLESKKPQYLAEVNRLQAQIAADEKIAKLQADVLTQVSAQLDEGVITSADYIMQVNAELRARQNLLIHQNELLKTQLNFWNERGGF